MVTTNTNTLTDLIHDWDGHPLIAAAYAAMLEARAAIANAEYRPTA
jgi:hypothetical protein